MNSLKSLSPRQLKFPMTLQKAAWTGDNPYPTPKVDGPWPLNSHLVMGKVTPRSKSGPLFCLTRGETKAEPANQPGVYLTILSCKFFCQISDGNEGRRYR